MEPIRPPDRHTSDLPDNPPERSGRAIKPDDRNAEVREEVREVLLEVVQKAAPVRLDPDRGIDYYDAVTRHERTLIESALRITAGKQNRAAGLLSVRTSTL